VRETEREREGRETVQREKRERDREKETSLQDACVMLGQNGDPFLNRCSIDAGRDKFTLLTCDPQTFKARKVKGAEVLRLSSAGSSLEFGVWSLNFVRSFILNLISRNGDGSC